MDFKPLSSRNIKSQAAQSPAFSYAISRQFSAPRVPENMLSEVVQKALNEQINMEFTSSYTYLAMASYCAVHNYPGCASWLLIQSQEENLHAMRLRSFLLDRDCPVVLHPIQAPKSDFQSIPEVFKCALENEIAVSESIDRLYELAHNEKAFAALVELQWFISEQVEEEKTVRDISARFQILKDDPSALIDLDRDLGERSQVPGVTEP